MTDHRDARESPVREPTDAAPDVRAALERSVAHLRTGADLTSAVNRRARRIRHRRLAVGTGIVAAVTAIAVLGVGSIVASTRRDSEPPVDIRPEVSTTHSSPTTRWGAVRAADEFAGTTLDRSLWTIVYSGPAGHPLGSWAPSDVAVGDGALRLSISRPAGARPPSTSGAVGARASAQRYGRWEIRWRMTPGRGVLGQFTLNPDAGGAPAVVLSLSPAAGTIEVTGAGVGVVAGAAGVPRRPGLRRDSAARRLRRISHAVSATPGRGPVPRPGIGGMSRISWRACRTSGRGGRPGPADRRRSRRRARRGEAARTEHPVPLWDP